LKDIIQKDDKGMIMYDIEAVTKTNIRPKVIVVGIGGAGGNMINAIIKEGLHHVSYIALNTDYQALENVTIDTKIVLGETLTAGMGTGANPEIGKLAIEENLEVVLEKIGDADIVFLVGGLGGGTGSGVLPLLAKVLQEKQILTIALVTKPFFFEGSRRMQVAQQAMSKIEEYADTVLVIPNQKLFEGSSIQDIPLSEAFEKINRVMVDCIKAVTETVFSPGHINVDFADIKTTMSRMGRAVIGIGIGEGENRAVDAIQKAIMSPLLEHNSLKGARSILLNISGDASLSLHEMNIIAGYVHDEVHPEAHIIVGSTILIHEKKDSISVTIIATGFEDQLKSRLHNKNILHTNTSHQSQFGFSQNNPMNNYSATPKQYYGSVHNTNNQPNFGFGSGHTLHEKIQNENNQRSNEKFTSNSNIDVPTFLRNQSIEK
jgi:cell division protein FtsZ